MSQGTPYGRREEDAVAAELSARRPLSGFPRREIAIALGDVAQVAIRACGNVLAGRSADTQVLHDLMTIDVMLAQIRHLAGPYEATTPGGTA